MRANLPPPDIGVPAAGALLFGIGLSALYSISLASGMPWAEKQLTWAVMALVGAGAAAMCPLSALRRAACFLMAAVIVGMCAVFLFDAGHGAHRWVRLGGWSLQPSEFCKMAALILAADYASRGYYRRDQKAFVLPVLLWLAAPLALLVFQRDIGSLILISGVVLAILFVAGLDIRRTAPLALLLVGAAAVLILSEPYRLSRVTSFVDPFLSDGGYNQKNAIMAFVLGGWSGRGLGRSIESWGYLPEPHNDFIIAIIGEETGLVGFFVVCALLAFLAGRAIAIGNRAEARNEIFGALYAFGFAAMWGVQAFINIGGNLSLLPFKGFTLPLVSYGGSSLLATGLMLGVLMRVDYENRKAAS